MEKISGLLLDHYDDLRGEVLRELYPTPDHVPDLVKQAHYLSPAEREALPTHVYALELVNDGMSFRKFACADAGNTVLSVDYFLSNRHKLPEEAQKVAAMNLTRACGWYDLAPPHDLLKVAQLPVQQPGPPPQKPSWGRSVLTNMKKHPLGAGMIAERRAAARRQRGGM